jgi:hypothetical protein
MTALEQVRSVLDAHHITYALIGAAALAAHGVARSTFDIDLLTTDHRVLEPGMWTPLGSGADVRRGDVDDPLAGVVRVSIADDRPIDLVVGRHAWQSRAVERASHQGGLPVVRASDLVLLKLYAGGAQDLWDIAELLRHAGASLPAEVEADLDALPEMMRQRWSALPR